MEKHPNQEQAVTLVSDEGLDASSNLSAPDEQVEHVADGDLDASASSDNSKACGGEFSLQVKSLWGKFVELLAREDNSVGNRFSAEGGHWGVQVFANFRKICEDVQK